jgi:hypothetical protein
MYTGNYYFHSDLCTLSIKVPTFFATRLPKRSISEPCLGLAFELVSCVCSGEFFSLTSACSMMANEFIIT